MPISEYFGGEGKKVMKSMKETYGPKKGEQVFYATAKKEGMTPEDSKDDVMGGHHQHTPKLDEFRKRMHLALDKVLDKKKSKDKEESTLQFEYHDRLHDALDHILDLRKERKLRRL